MKQLELPLCDCAEVLNSRHLDDDGHLPGCGDRIVNHPAHYTFGGVEVIDAIEAWQLGYHRGNVVKYLVRAGKKDPAKELEDLNKALWYLNRYIARRGAGVDRE